MSGNDKSGLNLDAKEGSTVTGNYIGTDVSGLQTLGNTEHGIRVNRTIEIATVDAGSGKVISGNGMSGILIYGGFADATYIFNNLIGTGAETTDWGSTSARTTRMMA